MKIAMIGLRGLGDGLGEIEKAVREISLRMVNAGHEVTCYCESSYSQEDSYEGVKLINVGTCKGKHLETFVYTVKSILHASKQDYDVIHVHALASSCLAWVPKIIYKKRVVITVHGLDWQRAKWGFLARQILKFGEWASAKFANVTLCVSRALSVYYKMRYAEAKVVYIPNGCNIPEGPYEPYTDLAPKSYFLYLGRLVPDKGIHYLIEAFKNITTDKSLVIAGPDSDGEYAAQLKQMAEGRDDISFTGPVYNEEKVRLLSNALLFILPSEIEGLPIVLLEAASYGVCTAVSEISTSEEVLDNKMINCGYHFIMGDIGQISTVLVEASKSALMTNALGLKLKEQVKELYNWDKISQETIDAYEQAIV
ncbi:MAG: glycosyltransferase family 4 protein [Lentisphaerales bacterium]|nr:glycosyltransferase family 4 protein [Lentisphaerales bacterium]